MTNTYHFYTTNLGLETTLNAFDPFSRIEKQNNPYCQGDGRCPGICEYCLEYPNKTLADAIKGGLVQKWTPQTARMQKGGTFGS